MVEACHVHYFLLLLGLAIMVLTVSFVKASYMLLGHVLSFQNLIYIVLFFQRTAGDDGNVFRVLNVLRFYCGTTDSPILFDDHGAVRNRFERRDFSNNVRNTCIVRMYNSNSSNFRLSGHSASIFH